MDRKNFLVIGGSKGIGLALVKKLSGEGHQVDVIARTEGDLPSLPNVSFSKIDVLGENFEMTDLPDKLDGVAYCPGSINLRPFRSLKMKDFQNDFEINVLGAVKVLQAVQRQLRKSKAGSVVLFSTVAVQQGMPFHASVSAAKGALEGLTRALAAEWAPHVRVNCIAPSLTDTPLAERLLSSPEKREAAANRHPLKKIGSAEELADIAGFLLNEKSSWITGQIIGVDGGMSSLKV